MKKNKILCLVICILISGPVMAETLTVKDMPELTPDNFDMEYVRITNSYDEITSQATPSLIRKFKHAKGASRIRLTKQQNVLKQNYLKVLDQKRDIEPIHELRESIKNLYLEHYDKPDFDEAKLNDEATRIAVGVFEEIEHLKKRYKSIFMPIVHNMMIDIGVRNRGACKHWAEDLLMYMRNIDREFFYLAWGEANMHKMTEHNVAVLVPKGRPFEDGMMIDPWRTGGRAWWKKVNDDKHYKWQQWKDFGTFQ